MAASWRQMRRVAMVSLAMVSAVSLGCRARDAEAEAAGEIVIERVSDPLRVVDIEVGRAIGRDVIRRFRSPRSPK